MPRSVHYSTTAELRAVFCSAAKLIPDPCHLEAIEDAVHRVHRATVMALLLLNMHLRDLLESEDVEATMSPAWADQHLAKFFESNKLMKAFYEVTTGGSEFVPDEAMAETLREHLPLDRVSLTDRSGIRQCLNYTAIGIAATASNNVWMHYRKRVERHVKWTWSLPRGEWRAMSKTDKKLRVLALKRVTVDMCRMPEELHRSDPSFHAWVDAERSRLGIEAALAGADPDKNLLYLLKQYPHRFLCSMAIMSCDKQMSGRTAFSLYPLRRTMVPRYVHFDQEALRDLLHLGSSEEKRKRQSKKRKRNPGAADEVQPDEDSLGLPPLVAQPLDKAVADADGAAPAVEGATLPVPKKRDRRTKAQMVDEKRELFDRVLDLKGARIHQRHLFDFSFRTDGVGAYVMIRKPQHETAERAVTASRRARGVRVMPTRGFWTADQLRAATGRTLGELAVIGIDPGKHDIIHCVDRDDPSQTLFRYTGAQRRHDTSQRVFADRLLRAKPQQVRLDETSLAECNSRAAGLYELGIYCRRRLRTLGVSLKFYGQMRWRQQRRKAHIRRQQSEEEVFARFEQYRRSHSDRLMVLAYGSWGMQAGRMPMRGLPPTIGVTFLRKLARRFVVCVTPERNTSKTCCLCGGTAGPCERAEQAAGKSFRGLRWCQDCHTHLSRDRNAACNIRKVFLHNFTGAEEALPFQNDPIENAIGEFDTIESM